MGSSSSTPSVMGRCTPKPIQKLVRDIRFRSVGKKIDARAAAVRLRYLAHTEQVLMLERKKQAIIERCADEDRPPSHAELTTVQTYQTRIRGEQSLADFHMTSMNTIESIRLQHAQSRDTEEDSSSLASIMASLDNTGRISVQSNIEVQKRNMRTVDRARAFKEQTKEQAELHNEMHIVLEENDDDEDALDLGGAMEISASSASASVASPRIVALSPQQKSMEDTMNEFKRVREKKQADQLQALMPDPPSRNLFAHSAAATAAVYEGSRSASPPSKSKRSDGKSYHSLHN